MRKPLRMKHGLNHRFARRKIRGYVCLHMKKLLHLLSEAFKGEGLNYTNMGINQAIFLLAVPMILEMFWESLFAIVDAFFVSKISVEAVATVGLTESVMTIIYSIAWGLSTAATALVARRVGEGNGEQAGEATAQAFWISLVMGIVFAFFGSIFAEDILHLMNASPEVIETGLNYTRLLFISSPSIILLFTLSGALRGAGDASKAMWSLGIANVINIILDVYLIWYAEIGVVGAAIATSIGRTVGVFIQLYFLSRVNGNVKMTMAQFKPNFEIIKTLLGLASGSAGQFIIASASWVFLARILSSFGSDVVAGYTIAIRIIVFTILPAWGMANAAATLVGQNLGAKQPEQAEKSAWRAAFYNMCFLLMVGIIFFIFAPNFIALFNPKPEVVKVGVQCLQILCLGYLFYGHGMVIAQALNGAGDTKSPTYINLICFWAIEIPLAYFLAKTMNFGPLGVFLSIAISESILAILAILVFRRGKWKTIEV